MINLRGSNYLYLEQISMVPKIFDPLRVDCIYQEHINKNDLICCPFKGKSIHFKSGSSFKFGLPPTGNGSTLKVDLFSERACRT